MRISVFDSYLNERSRGILAEKVCACKLSHTHPSTTNTYYKLNYHHQVFQAQTPEMHKFTCSTFSPYVF